MRVVSENSDEEIAKRQAERQLGFELREMAANLLRVIRGAGRPGDLRKQLLQCLQTYEAHGEASGYYPMPEVVARMLDAEKPWPVQEEGDHRGDAWPADFDEPGEHAFMMRRYERRMQKAALQITASTLADQPMQVSRAERDLGNAIEGHERSSRNLAAYWAAQRSAASAAARAPRRTVPKKAKRGEAVPAPLAPSVPRAPLPSAARPKPEVDPLKPPPYEVRPDFGLPADIGAEFGVGTVLELVCLLNETWKAQGRRPLAQGSFPRNAATLAFVVKELRRTR